MDNNISTSKIISKLISLITSVIMIALFMSLKIQKIEIVIRNYIIIAIIVSLVFAFMAILFKYYYISQKYKYMYYQIIDFLLLFNSALLFIQIFFVLVFFPAAVSQTSMHPTLEHNDNLIVKSMGTPKRFDIIVLKLNENNDYNKNEDEEDGGLNENSDYNKNEDEEDEGLIVKRIIAMGGDTFYFNYDGILFLNGQEIDEKYLKDEAGNFRHGTMRIYNKKVKKYESKSYNTMTQPFHLEEYAKINGVMVCTPHEECTVPIDYLFVLGDNRTGSSDSRYFGLFHKSQIIGIVIYRQIGILKWEKM